MDPVTWLFYLVAFGAGILGKICGMGGGVIGSEVGGRINKRMDDRAVTRLFVGAMVLILCINVYNIARYLF